MIPTKLPLPNFNRKEKGEGNSRGGARIETMTLGSVVRGDTMPKTARYAAGDDAAAVSATEDEDGARVFHHDAKIVVAEKHDAKFIYRSSPYMIDPRDPFMRKWRGAPSRGTRRARSFDPRVLLRSDVSPQSPTCHQTYAK